MKYYCTFAALEPARSFGVGSFCCRPSLIGRAAAMGGVLLILLSWPPAFSEAQTPPDAPDVQAALTGDESVRVIVALQTQESGGEVGLQIVDQVKQAQETVMDELEADEFELIQAYDVIPGLVGEVTAAGLETLLARPEVAAVALDLPVQSALTESAVLIGADVVQEELGFTGAGVNVAVLDTGVEADHPDLADNVVVEKCFNRSGCPPDNVGESSDADDGNGHGTHVAGIITGRGERSPRGIAPDAGLVAVRVLNGAGSGFTSDVLAGLEWAVANQARYDIKIINLSLGGGSYSGVCDDADANTRLYAEVVELAHAAGMTIFAASGNSGLLEQMMAPACLSGVISVGSTYDANFGSFSSTRFCTDQNARIDEVACSSNSSPELDILAPGAAIISTGLGSGQASKSGTSMATAEASAVAALMLEADSTLTPTEIEMILQETGTPVTDQRNGRVTPRIDALAAVEQLGEVVTLRLSGTVILEGRADHSGSQVFLNEQACPNVAVSEPAATTEADGRFALSVPAGQSFACLQVIQPSYLPGQRLSPDGDLGRITLLGGDTNGDGLIDVFDLSILGSHFGTDSKKADINADGQVDIYDLVIVAGNYNRAGPINHWN